MKNDKDINLAFADINRSLDLDIKNGSFRYFTSEDKLHNLINK